MAERTTRLARWYLVTFTIISLALGSVLSVEELRGLRVACVWVLGGSLALLLGLVRRIALLGDADVPRGAFCAGCAFMLGGSMLDVGATLAHTPDLSQEANPLVRALLDSGHELWLVYLLAGVGQAADLLWGCLALGAFLRHRRAVIRSAWAVRPAGEGEFVRAALTGRRMTLRQFWFPLRAAEFPRAYQFACLLLLWTAPTWVGRWYLGLKWLGLVPPTPAGVHGVTAAAMLLTLIGYWTWLRRQYALGVRGTL